MSEQANMMEVPPELQSTLEPQEQLQWWGRPQQGIMFSKYDILFIPISLMWGGAAFCLEYDAFRGSHPDFLFALFGLPFVVVGFFLIIGRFLLGAWWRSQTWYGITGKRIIITRRRGYESIDLYKCKKISVEKYNDNRGSIFLGSHKGNHRDYSVLQGIDQVDEVFATIRRLQNAKN